MDTIRSVTGLDLASEEQAQQYYAEHRPDGSPEFSADVLPYLRSIGTGKDWSTILRENAFAKDIGDRALDPCRIIFGDKKWEENADERRVICDEFTARALESFDAEGVSDAAAEVFAAFARMSPLWGLVPAQHEEATAEYLWAKMRCVLAGAGYRHWNRLATVCADLYAYCPWAVESQDEWVENNRTAHGHCGWPIQIAHVRWSDVCYEVDKDWDRAPWMNVVAAFHVLKHIRLTPSDHSLVVLYDKLATRIQPAEGATVIDGRQLTQVMRALRANKGKKEDSPLVENLGGVLNRIQLSNFLRVEPLSELDPDILSGPWSTVTPHPSLSEFFQFGLQLDGVWRARGGHIQAVGADHDLISRYGWNYLGAAAHQSARDFYENILPKTYEPAHPVDVFSDAFPNMHLGHFDEGSIGGAAALLAAPIFADLLRKKVPALRKEFPLVCFLPLVPTNAGSTDTGKSYAALCYAKASVPSVQEHHAKESTSNPDQRAIQSLIQTYGTVCLDEFIPPGHKEHIFARENLQTLCTGGSITAGRVMENDPTPLSLRSHITLSAKVMKVPDDVANRSLFWFIGKLTAKQSANAETIAKLADGYISLCMRLGAWGICEQYQLGDWLRKAPKPRDESWRFVAHHALAVRLYDLRREELVKQGLDPGPVDAAPAIATALKQMRDFHMNHTQNADVSGLLSNVQEGTQVNITLQSIFGDLSATDMTWIADNLEVLGVEKFGKKWASPTDLLKSVAAVKGLAGRPLGDLLPILTGQRLRASDRHMAHFLVEELDRMVPEGCEWTLPGMLGEAGWVMKRGAQNRFRLFRVEPVAQLPS